MPTVSLCMIVRNEARWLRACLESVRGLVHEMVVVDTGSADDTRALAAQAGARVFDYPWTDDFSAARNEALRHATGDWVLQLDADERMTPPSHAALRAALEADDFDCGMLRLHDATAVDAPWDQVVTGAARQHPPVALARLFRRTPDLRYRGVVHECVTEWLLSGHRRARALDVDLVHLGAVPEVRAQLDKRGRNTALLRKRCAAEPNNPLPWGYLALELLHGGDDAGAREAVDHGWPALLRSPRHVLAQRLMVVRATLALRDGRPEVALETVDAGEGHEGPSADSCHLRGCAEELLAFRAPLGSEPRRRHLERALAAYQSASSFDPNETQAAFVDGAWGHASWLREGALRLFTGELDRAQACFDAAAGVRTSAAVAAGRAELALRRGDCTEALRRIEPALSEGPDGWTVAAEAAHRLGALADVQHFLARAEAQSSKGFYARHRAERWVALACAVSAYQGRPQPGPGVVGMLTALMSGATPAAMPLSPERRLPAEPMVDDFLRNLVRANRAALLEALLSPAAEAMLPGLKTRLEGALAGLGFTLPSSVKAVTPQSSV